MQSALQAENTRKIVAPMSLESDAAPVHRVEISRSALRHNVGVFRKLAPESRFMAVVKSNAYGHDLDLVVESVRDIVDWFGVNSVSELRRLRRLDRETPVLVMGLNARDLGALDAAELADLNQAGPAAIVVSSIKAIELLRERAPALSFHLKVDTGLSRLGASGDDLEAIFEYLAARPGLPWAGLMTHFANVEDVTDQTYALEQLRRFDSLHGRALTAAGDRELIFHAAASAPALILPPSRLDLLRVGISLYGFWPSPQTKLSALSHYGEAGLPELRPVMRWCTRVVHVHRVPAGTSVGYGCTYRVEQDTIIATLPVGYYEGYERKLSNRSYVLIRGRRAKLIGRVSMNMITVDVNLIPGVEVGDTAVLLGRDGDEEISADALGDLTGTINYEVVTRVNAELERVLVEQED